MIRGEGTHSFAGEGVGGDPVLTRDKTLWYSKYSICTLWCPLSTGDIVSEETFKIIVSGGATKPKHKGIVGAT
jgi:hypothetical protein